MSNRTRNYHIAVWVTKDEKKLIRERMQACDEIYIGRYIRKMAIDGFIVNRDNKEIKELAVQIRKIGININQIAKKANETNAVYQGDIDDVKGLMMEIWRLLRSKE